MRVGDKRFAHMEWLRNGLPKELEERMKAAYDVALPIAEVQSELVAPGLSDEKQAGLGLPVTMLRDAAPTTARVCSWSGRKGNSSIPPRTLFKAGLSHSNRLWLELLHAGFSDEQQRIWDKGEDWPGWAELTAEVLR
jgi:hypothetical protein